MTKHILSQIDLEHKTACCTVCGNTEIHVPKNYNPAKSILRCIEIHKERNLNKRMWACLSPEERKLLRKEKHNLTEIDPESHRASCAICGLTDIYEYSKKGKTFYRCATYNRLRNRSEGLRDFIQPACESVPLAEIYEKKKEAKGLFSWVDLGQINSDEWPRLSQPSSRLSTLQDASEKKKQRNEENTRLVHEYKRSHSCKYCGVQALEPRKLRFFELSFPRDQKIRRLVVKLAPEELILELEKHELYCSNCHPRMLKEYHQKSPGPPLSADPPQHP